MKFLHQHKLIAGISLLTLIILSILFYQKKTVKPQTQSKIQAIIFDMDGTTIQDLWKITNMPILHEHATHLTDEEKNVIRENMHKIGIYDFWKLIHSHCSPTLNFDEVIEANVYHLKNHYRDHGVDLIPHFEVFHKQVVNSGLKTAIATSSQQHIIDVLTKRLPLENYFGQHIYNADHVNKVFKPAPDIYLYAAQQLGVHPCNCIAIEDSSSGIKAAKAAGMYCIGINTSKNVDDLILADLIVDCYSQIDLQNLLNSIK